MTRSPTDIAAPTRTAAEIDSLVERFRARQAKIGVVRLGYVGLSVLRTAAARGSRTPGFDIKAAAWSGQE